MANLSQGSAVVSIGDTMVLVTSNSSDPRPGIDFFPLTIDYREKTYAAGKIPGGFFKREARPTEKEVLACRAIDRPIRPMFPDGYKDEVQVLCNVLSWDGVNNTDVLAGIGASMSMMLSPIPLLGPLAWVRVAYIDDKLVVFPDHDKMGDSKLDLLVAGSKESITMVEAGAKEVSETLILDALAMAHEAIGKLCDLQTEVIEALHVTPARETYVSAPAEFPELGDKVSEVCKTEIKSNIVKPTKPARQKVLKEVREKVLAALADLEGTGEEGKYPVKAVKNAFKEVCNEVLRELVFEGTRVDGRKPADIRDITCEVGVLPRAHGSALFTRGETQALVTSTLGTGLDEQMIDGLGDTFKKNFYLHYNFPPFSVGEVRPVRGTSRREIGHGNLAERSIIPVIPDDEKFPYTLRIVSDILMSNGSSSMASVCGGTLSMYDAGIKIKAPVAGIAMGLISDGDNHVVLSDILGDEDHSGDMDFKVTGTPEGITALQMDIKIKGTPRALLEKALEQAHVGRMHILGEMKKAMDAPRDDYSPHAPRITQMQVPVEKIGMVIGPGGKNIRQIQEETKTTIQIIDDGTVKIFAPTGDGAERAKQWIEDLTATAEIGKIYEGPVVQMRDFGVFVQILPNQDGLIHVSELSDGYVDRPEDVVKQGEMVKAKCIAIDDTGKIKLSRRAVLMEERGEEYIPPAPPSGGRGRGGGRDGGRGGDRGRGRGGRDGDRGGRR